MNKQTEPMKTEDWEAYVRGTSALIKLPIPESSLAGVVATLKTTSEVARPLLDLELPEGAEMAPTFKS